MARFYGKVGFSETIENPPDSGIWKDGITERNYYGDQLTNGTRWQQSTDGPNDNLVPSVKLSIVADPYAYLNFSKIKYVEYMGALWKVMSAEPQRPRIILTLGGVWNGDEAGTSSRVENYSW